jgi:hypothetical protein
MSKMHCFSKLPWLGSHMATTLKAFWGPTLLMFLERHNDSQSCNSQFFSYKCAWVFFTISKIRPFFLLCIYGYFFKATMAWKPYTTLRVFWGPTFADVLVGMIESCNSPFFSCNYVCGLWHKQQTCHRIENLCHINDE